MAVNCCVAPAAIFALAGAKDIDLTVTAAGTDPHPVIAIASDSTRQETGTQSQRRRREAISLISKGMPFRNHGRRVPEIVPTEDQGAQGLSPPRRRCRLVAITLYKVALPRKLRIRQSMFGVSRHESRRTPNSIPIATARVAFRSRSPAAKARKRLAAARFPARQQRLLGMVSKGSSKSRYLKGIPPRAIAASVRCPFDWNRRHFFVDHTQKSVLLFGQHR